MKLFIIVILVIAATTNLQAAETGSENSKIYKSTDESGRTVFSDEATDGAEEIELKDPATYSSDTLTRRYDEFTRSSGGDEANKDLSYDRLAITSPTNDETIRSNPGNFELNLDVSPAPAEGHTLQLLMDGEVYQRLDSTGPVQLTNVDRGTHQLQLQVVDGDGKVVEKGPAVTMHLLRHSILHPQGRKSQNN